MNKLFKTIWFKSLAKCLGVCLLLLISGMVFSSSVDAQLIYGAYTFDADGDADEAAWTFVSDGGPDGLNAPGSGNRAWHHDTNDTTSSNLGPTSGQGGSPDGYVFTESSSPAAASDTFHMTFDTILDASTRAWSIDFYTNQRGNDNNATVVVQSNENGAGWIDRGATFGGATDPDKVATSGVQIWSSRTVDLSGLISNASTQVRLLVTLGGGGTIWNNDYGLDTITLTGTPLVVTGTVYTDEGDTNMGSGKTIAVSINGMAIAGTASTDSNGYYAISSNTVPSAGDIITVYIDDAVENAVTITEVAGVLTNEIDLYQGRLIVRNDNGANLTNVDLATADNSGDQDITVMYSMSANELTVAGTVELYVDDVGTYVPGDSVNADNLDINGILSMGTNSLTVSGSFDATGGSIVSTGTVTFDSTSSETIILSGNSLANVDFNGAGGTWILEDSLDVDGTLKISDGTLDVNVSENNSITIAEGFVNRGSFNSRSGLVTLDGTDQRLDGSITFNNLTKQVVTTGTLTFGAGDTYNIQGILLMGGVSGQLLGLVSDSPSVDWNIQVSSSTAVNFVSVRDSEVVGSSGRDMLALSSTNGGGNDEAATSPQWVFVSNRYWVGPAGGNTSVDANWSSTEAACGGGTATVVPTVNDNAVFSAMCDNNATVDSTLNLGGLQIDSGHTGTITPNALIDVDGPFTMNDGTIDFNVNDTNMEISGNVFITAGTVTAGAGTVTLDGTLLYDDANNTDFGHVILGSMNNTITLFDDFLASRLIVTVGNQLITDGYEVDVNGIITINGTFDAGSGTDGNTSINVAGNWDMSTGVFVSTNSTVSFDGAINVTSNGKSFNNVNIGTATTGATVTTVDDMDIAGDLLFGTAATSNWNISNDTVYIGGDVDFVNLDTFTTASSTIQYNGIGLQTVASNGETFNVVEGANTSSQGINFTEAFTTTDLASTTFGTKMQFQQGTTFTITGNLVLAGSSNQEIELDSVDGSSQFTFNIASEQDVDFVKVGNSNATGFDINASNSVNDGGTDQGTGTPNWVFVGAGSNVFTVSGTTTFVVPKGVTKITVKAWGAGGGGAGGGDVGIGGAGGGGGFALATVSVTPFETLNVHVGGFGDEGEFSTGGAGTLSGDGGGGGGRSGVFRSLTPLTIAGGGGGGGGGDNSSVVPGGSGGPGGGVSGSDGGTSTGVTGGGGGTQLAVGAAGTGGNNIGAAGVGIAGGDGGDGDSAAGSKGTRANGGSSFGGAGGEGDSTSNGYAGGGGGGAGFFGGGGGSGALASNAGGGGGGGGASYAEASATSVTLTSGSGASAGNNGDSDYAGSAGLGGTGGALNAAGTDGNNGRIVINYVTATIDIVGSSDLPDATTVGIAVNGSLCLQTGTVTGGAFTIDDAPILINEPVTIWADGVAAASEATTIFKYDGAGPITGVELNAATLIVGSNDNTSLSLTDFYHYDQSSEEDILYTTTTGTVVTVDSADDQTLEIRSGNTLVIETLEGLVVHNVDINGVLSTSGTILVDGNWDATGSTITPSGGTVTFNAAADQSIITGNQPFPNLVISNSGGAADDDIIVNGTLDVNGTLRLQDGEIDLSINDSAMSVSGSLILNGGAFTPGAGNIILDGAGTVIDNIMTSLGTLILNGSTVTTTLGTDISATNLTINTTHTLVTDGYEISLDGTLDLNGILNATTGSDGFSDIDIGGGWDSTGGTFTGIGSTVLFSGTSSMQIFDIVTAGTTFNNIVFNDNMGGTTWELENDIDINGNITIADGNLDANVGENNLINAAGNWIQSGGSFISRQGTVTFDGASGTQTITATSTFYNLVIDDSNGGADLTVQMTSTLVVDGDLSVNDGVLNLDGNELNVAGALSILDTLDAGSGADNNSTMFVAGDWDTSTGTFTNTNSTVILTGTTAGLTITSGAQVFNNLIINDGLIGYWTLDQSTGDLIDLSGYENNGVISGAPVSTTAVTTVTNFSNPRAMEFSGTPDSVVVSGFNEVLLPATITAWIYANTLEACDGIVFSRGTDISGINIAACGDITRMGYHWNDTAATYNWVGGPSVSTGQWLFVALVVEPAQATAYVGSNTGVSSGINVVAHTSSVFDGLRIGEDSTGIVRHFDGRIDDVRIYNRALSETEIQRLSDGEHPRTSLGTYTLQDNLDVNGTLALFSGELDVGANRMINVSGDWDNRGGVFTAQNGLVVFDGASGTQNILTTESFYNLQIDDPDNGADLTVVSYGTLDINGQYLQTDSTMDLATANGGMWVNGDFTLQSGAFNPPVATIIFDGDKTFIDNIMTNVGTILIDPDTTLGSDFTCTSLTINTGDTLFTDGYEIDCSANMKVEGTLDAQAGTDGFSTLNFGRNWRSHNGLIIMGQSTVVMDDTDGSNVFRTGDSNTFYNVTFDDVNGGGDTTWELRDNINIWGTLQILDGTVDARDGVNEPIEVRGNWNSTGGVFLQRQGTVTFAGMGEQTITVDDDTFYNVSVFNSSGSTVYFVGSTTFNDFTSTVGSTELNFEAGSTFQVDGSLRLDGQGAGTRIVLNSSNYSTRFNFDVRNYLAITDFLDIRNSEALTNDIIAQNSLDTTNTDSGEASPRWLFGMPINVSGVSNLADATTIAIAVNNQLQGVTASVVSGAWTIVNAVVATNDIVTVWTDGVVDSLESTGITKYDGSANISGMVLNTGTLSLGSDDDPINITMIELGQYDNDDDEDIIYVRTPGSTLQSAASPMSFDVLSTGTFMTDGYDLEISGSLDIHGTLDASSGSGGNTTIELNGSWDSSGGVFTNTDSTVLFIGTIGTQILQIDGTASFDHVKFDDNGGATTWELQGTMTVDGTFQLSDGVVDTNSVGSYGLTSTGTFAVNGGDFIANASTITAGSGFLVSATNAFVFGTSVVDLIGTGDFECQSSGSTVPCVYDVQLASLGQTTTLQNSIVVGNILSIGPGNFIQSGFQNILFERDVGVPMLIDTNANISIGAFIYNGGTGDIASGDHDTRVTLRPSSETYVLTGTFESDRLEISDNSGSGRATLDTTSNNYSMTVTDLNLGRSGDASRLATLILNDSVLTIQDNLNSQDAGYNNIIEANNATIYIDDDWNASNGITMRMGNSTVVFNGNSGTSDIIFPTTGTVGIFGNILIDDTDGGSNLVVQMSGTLDMTGSLRIDNGSLNLDGYEAYIDGNVDINDELDASSGVDGNVSMRVGGNWDATGGTFTDTDSTVMFTGVTNSLTITSNGNSFNNLIVNGSVGLVGYWKLDESVSPAIDYSGYGNNGVWAAGVTSTTNVTGTINFNNPGAASFDGSTEYIQIDDPGTNSELDFDAGDQITIAAWVRPDGLTSSDYANILNKGISSSSVNGNYGIQASNIATVNREIVFFFRNAADTLWDNYMTDDSVLVDQAWQHVAVTYTFGDGGTAKIYYNGIERSGSWNGSGGTNPPLVSNEPIWIGNDRFGEEWDGDIDEVRIYNRELSSTEIYKLSRGYMPGTGFVTYTLQDNLDVNGTLSLNDGILNTGANRQINVARSWLNNGGVFVENSGLVEFDGTSNDALILAGSHTFNNVDITGIGTWTLQDNLPITGTFDISAGALTYATSTIIEPINIDGGTSLTGGTFTGNALRFRHDGDLDIDAGIYTAPTNVVEIDGFFDHSGGTFSNSSSTVMFTGTSTALTIDTTGGATFQNVIVNDGLVGYWKLDEINGSTAKDSSGYDLHGVRQGVPTVITSGLVDTNFDNPAALDFDADTEYVLIDHDPKLANLTEFTLSAWVRIDGLSGAGWGRIFHKSDGGTGDDFSLTHRQSTNTIYFRIFTGGALIQIFGTAVNPGDPWEHVVGVWNGSNITLYQNGVLTAGPTAATGALRDSKERLSIGRHADSSTRTLDGAVDDVRIYNRALTVAEIQLLANGNQPSTGVATHTLQSALDVDGTLRLNSGTLDVSTSNYQINVGSDWENFGGVFNARSGTVVFDGSDYRIPASETFYNFKKVMTSGPAQTLTVGRSSTITINGTMQLQGFDGSNLLFLQSSSIGTQWNIDPQGLRDSTFLSVQDSNNLTPPEINPTNSIDAGNTTLWFKRGPLKGAVIMVE